MFRKKRLIIFSAVIIAVFSLGLFLKRQYVVPIIMYHSVSSSAKPENRLSVSVDAFNRQMRFLKNQRYNVVPLETVADLISQKKKVPARTIAITFDDGYKDNYTYAFPVLKKYGLPATIFIILKEVGRVQGDRLSWDEIKVMRDSGVITFASHGLGPEPLINIKSPELLKKEIFDSKRILENKLDRPVNIFSYAGGLFDSRIKQLVKDAGYRLAVVTNPGKKFPNDDIFALKRLRISSTSDSLFVFWIETSGFYNFIRERRHK